MTQLEHVPERVGDNKVRKIDVRVVAATNECLSVAVQQGRFRADLYYRLSAYPINIPPLRERKEDIPLFVVHFWRNIELFTTKMCSEFLIAVWKCYLIMSGRAIFES